MRNYLHFRKTERFLSLWEQKNGGFPWTQWQQDLQVNIKGTLKTEVKDVSMQIWEQKSFPISQEKQVFNILTLNKAECEALLQRSPKRLDINSTDLNLTKHIINSHRTLPSYLYWNREKSEWRFPMLTEEKSLYIPLGCSECSQATSCLYKLTAFPKLQYNPVICCSVFFYSTTCSHFSL